MHGKGRVEHLGGRWVHRVDYPGEEPPVVLLGGCGVPSYQWRPVIDSLNGQRIVALDRPGLVATNWPGRLPTLQEEVQTLVELLTELGTPAVLVGHSMGGPHAEATARQRPDLVGGLVLADASVDLDPRPPVADRVHEMIAHLARRLARHPLPARVASFGERAISTLQSARLRWYHRRTSEHLALFRRPDTVASVLAEQAAHQGQLWELAQIRQQYPWAGTPTVVLTATGGSGGRRWLERQSRLARLLGARHVAVRDSRHMMMIDRPDLIAAAVASLARRS